MAKSPAAKPFVPPKTLGACADMLYKLREERLAQSKVVTAIEDQEKVFERFVRGGQAVGEGAGLGLAIVRDIVLAHGGSVELATSRLGGLAVTFRFPVRF